MGAPSKWKIHIMQIWPREGEVWERKEGREGGRRAANRAYMMNIGHGDSHTESGDCGSHRISFERGTTK